MKVLLLESWHGEEASEVRCEPWRVGLALRQLVPCVSSLLYLHGLYFLIGSAVIARNVGHHNRRDRARLSTELAPGTINKQGENTKMARRCFAVALTAVVGLSLPASAQTTKGSAESNRSASGTTRETTRRIENSARDMLLKPVKSVEWDEITFEEVIEWLRGFSEENVNVVPRWAPLNVEGVDRDSFITLRLSNVTVAEVLNQTVEQLADGGQVTYRAVGNILKISTTEDFNRKMYVRVYPVPDLTFIVPDFTQSAPVIDLESASRSTGGGGGGGGGQSVFGGASSSSDEFEDNEQEKEERMEELIDMIRAVIAPESWAETGSGLGELRFWSSSLVVYNTADVHEQIAGYFALMD